MSELRAAIDAAYAMPASLAQVEALDLLARQAEQRNDPELTMHGLFSLYYAAFKMMLVERMLATYTAMRGTFDRHAARLSPETAVNVAHLGMHALYLVDGIPEISRAKIDELYQDVDRAYVAHGLSRYSLLAARLSSYFSAGYLERARALYAELTTMTADDEGCEACQISRRAWFLLELERPDEAIEASQPIVARGVKCESQPAGSWASLMIPHARRGEWQIARSYHARLHRVALARPTWVHNAGASAKFAAIDRAYAKGKNVIERALPHALNDATKAGRFGFFTAVIVWLDAVARERSTVTLALPPTFSLYDPSGRYAIAPLRAWFADAAEQIAGLFDRRNGNTYWADELAKASDVLELVPERDA
ncbi:MAG TPA: hypothetical protein VIV11_24775 [Kofleriaceae bacterium]